MHTVENERRSCHCQGDQGQKIGAVATLVCCYCLEQLSWFLFLAQSNLELMTLPQPPEYCDYRCVAFKYSFELGLGNPDLTHGYVQGVHGHDHSIDDSYCLCCITAALVAFLCHLRAPHVARHVSEFELETACLFCAPGTLDVTCYVSNGYVD